MAASAFGFAIAGCALKYLYNIMEISSFEVIYRKQFTMMGFEYLFIKATGHDHMEVPQDLRVTVLLRAVTGFGGIAGYFTATKLTSLSKATVLYWMNPIFTALYARIFLKETLSCYDWAAIFLAFAGVVLLQNPFGQDVVETEIDRTQDMLGSCIAVAGALSVGFAFMLMRKMADRLYFMVPPFYFATYSTIITTPIAIAQMSRQSSPTHYTLEGVLLILAVSFFSFIG